MVMPRLRVNRTLLEQWQSISKRKKNEREIVMNFGHQRALSKNNAFSGTKGSNNAKEESDWWLSIHLAFPVLRSSCQWQTAAAASRIVAAEQLLRCGGAILYFLQQEWNFIIEKKTLHPSFPELIISPGSGLNLLSTSKEMMKNEDKILQKGH